MEDLGVSVSVVLDFTEDDEGFGVFGVVVVDVFVLLMSPHFGVVLS